MESKDEAELEVDESKVRIVRWAQQTGGDRIDVNVYDYPDDRLRDYTQFNFRVDDRATGRAATYVGKEKHPMPDVTALRALHEYGFECTNFSLPELWEDWEPKEALEVILKLVPLTITALEKQDDPTAERLVTIGGRYFQHIYGWMENAEAEEKESVTELLETLADKDVTATKEINKEVQWDEEMKLAEKVINTLISHEHDIDFEEDFIDE